MVDYLAHFESALTALKDERRYRVFADLEAELVIFRMRPGGARPAGAAS